ncbi:putative porin [bacterium]|nr:putative porin [bacterium]
MASDAVCGGAQYTFAHDSKKPVTVLAEYMVNTESDAEAQIAAANELLDPDISYEPSDDTGYQFALRYGKPPSKRGEWNATARFKMIGANAIIAGFGDGESGWANTESAEFNWRYMLADNSSVSVNFFNNKMHNAFGFAVPDNKARYRALQIDWGFRF